MTVLSDGTIRAEIEAGRLVPRGLAGHALHCSYEFLPGKIFPGGAGDDDAFVIDWTDGKTDDRRYLVQPAAVVWIRTQHEVSLPNDVCGLWLQTNTLSREGLLLVNHSLVEPGYHGFLSCNFVNFGREAVAIHPDRPLAKLLFLRLDKAAVDPFDKALPAYDRMIAKLARQGPKSFLQVSELSVRLENARRDAEDRIDRLAREEVEEIKKRAEAVVGDLEKQAGREIENLKAALKEAAETRRKEELTTIKTDITSYAKKVFAWAFAALIVLGLANMGSQWLTEKIKPKPNDAEIERKVEQALSKHIVIDVSKPRPAGAAPGATQPASAPPASGPSGREGNESE